jgi:hypothetical protein
MIQRIVTPVNKTKWEENLTVYFKHHSSMFQEAWEWCEDNCVKPWYLCTYNPFYFFFEDSTDAMLFKLTWG